MVRARELNAAHKTEMRNACKVCHQEKYQERALLKQPGVRWDNNTKDVMN
jgi:hypothetical protein